MKEYSRQRGLWRQHGSLLGVYMRCLRQSRGDVQVLLALWDLEYRREVWMTGKVGLDSIKQVANEALD